MATIVRGPRAADHFTIIANGALRDERLSWKARGLLAYLLSMDTGWVTSIRQLAKVSPSGEAAVETGLTELERAGYLDRVQTRAEGDKAGTFSGTEYHVRDESTVPGKSGHGVPGPPESDLPVTRFSGTGSSGPGESGTKKTSPKKTSSEEDSNGSAARSAATADEVDPFAAAASDVPRASARAAAAEAPRQDQGDEAPPVVVGVLTPRRPETPAGILEAAMLTPEEQAAFRQWLIEQTGARNPDGLIVSLSRSGALSTRILEWRTPAGPAQGYPSPSTPPRAPWCGNCDPDTRNVVAWSEHTGEVVMRCRDCHPLAGQLAPGAGAAADIARDTHQLTPPGDGRAAFLAARARLPKGTGRRRTAHDTATHPTHTETEGDQQ